MEQNGTKWVHRSVRCDHFAYALLTALRIGTLRGPRKRPSFFFPFFLFHLNPFWHHSRNFATERRRKGSNRASNSRHGISSKVTFLLFFLFVARFRVRIWKFVSRVSSRRFFFIFVPEENSFKDPLFINLASPLKFIQCTVATCSAAINLFAGWTRGFNRSVWKSGCR